MKKRHSELVIEKLTDKEKLQLIRQYEQFEANGFIGDCELRTLAEAFPEGDRYVLTFMTLLGIECYRYFANRYLSI